MFMGTIPAPVQAMIHENVQAWDVKHVWVGCSGNFTVERVLAPLNKFEICGNDVTVYTSIIGKFLNGTPEPITSVAPEYEEQFGWMNPYLATAEGLVASMLLATRFSGGIGRPNHPFFGRMVANYKRQWDEVFSKTVERLQKLNLRLKRFYCGGVLELLDELNENDPFICYPPFYGGDYEAMFKRIQQLFGWIPPVYQAVTPSSKQSILKKITQRDHWMMGINFRDPQYEPYLKGITQTSNRSEQIYIYTSHGKVRTVLPRQQVTPVTLPRLPDDYIITADSKLSLVALTNPQFCALRSIYMNQHIAPGLASVAFGVMVDKQLVGVYGFSMEATLTDWGTMIIGPHAYMITDFSIRPAGYKHLSKLVLFACLSKESKLVTERRAKHRIRGCVTTAFSKNPISMKYRGVFDLLTRKEVDKKMPDGSITKQWRLNYGAEMGLWTLDEGFAVWKKKYGGRI